MKFIIDPIILVVVYYTLLITALKLFFFYELNQFRKNYEINRQCPKTTWFSLIPIIELFYSFYIYNIIDNSLGKIKNKEYNHYGRISLLRSIILFL